MPAVLVGIGIVGLKSHTIDLIDRTARNILIENIDRNLTIDNFPQYGPFLTVYGSNAFGIKSKNNFKHRTIILGTAYLIMGGVVNIIKKTGNLERPDGSSKNSFPSDTLQQLLWC